MAVLPAGTALRPVICFVVNAHDDVNTWLAENTCRASKIKTEPSMLQHACDPVTGILCNTCDVLWMN